mmetsp:Transcript_37249/g.55730  ORF Transcript_37249/g.55730 Transcript_37249/m.55730 type:complete len:106 (-) Transcript_37249:59-376(-)
MFIYIERFEDTQEGGFYSVVARDKMGLQPTTTDGFFEIDRYLSNNFTYVDIFRSANHSEFLAMTCTFSGYLILSCRAFAAKSKSHAPTQHAPSTRSHQVTPTSKG